MPQYCVLPLLTMAIWVDPPGMPKAAPLSRAALAGARSAVGPVVVESEHATKMRLAAANNAAAVAG
jgi:hypothetical protein